MRYLYLCYILIFLCIATVGFAATKPTTKPTTKPAAKPTINANAKKYLPILADCFVLYWPAAVGRYIPAGQVEQESNWNPYAHLHTSREDGYGLVQITVTERFNNFITATNYKPLKDWKWQTDKYNVRNQLTFLVLQDKSNYAQLKYIKDPIERWKCTMISYNAGYGRILKRRQYAIAKGLPTDRWTGGLELAHGPLEDRMLYGRPLWKAINSYPVIIFRKAEKYKPYMGK